MIASKALPNRPSLDSLRKQAKRLARNFAAGDAAAIARARAHLPGSSRLTQREAQLVIAREYGFPGWHELTIEVRRRVDDGLRSAAERAERAIHDDDVERLQALVSEFPELLSWRGGGNGGLLEIATSAFGDAGDAEREQWFTRARCAELLIDAGAPVTRSACNGILRSRARGLLSLFERKGVLPRELKFAAAEGDLGAVRSYLDSHASDLETINEAFVAASRFDREAAASLLLERSRALDSELARNLAGVEPRALIAALAKADFEEVAALGLWKVFVMHRVRNTLHAPDVAAFAAELRREAWLLADAHVAFQAEIIESAAYKRDRGAEIIGALLELEPAILRQRPPPRSRAIEWAFMYGNTSLLPMLTRIWTVPDDLPSAAGRGDLERVRLWFDEAGAIRDLPKHYPYNDATARSHLKWDPPTGQMVLDVAFAFAVINSHFDVADFLLERGADIDTNWNSHEPASILHHVAFLPNPYERMQYLVDRGIDLTIKDYRWNATAEGWAFHALGDEDMAAWLAAAERGRQRP